MEYTQIRLALLTFISTRINCEPQILDTCNFKYSNSHIKKIKNKQSKLILTYCFQILFHVIYIKINNEVACLHFLSYFLKIRCAFYIYSTSQCGPVPFHVLSWHMWLPYMLGFTGVFQDLTFYNGNHFLLKIHLWVCSLRQKFRPSPPFLTTEGSHKCPHKTLPIMLVPGSCFDTAGVAVQRFNFM